MLAQVWEYLSKIDDVQHVMWKKANENNSNNNNNKRKKNIIIKNFAFVLTQIQSNPFPLSPANLSSAPLHNQIKNTKKPHTFKAASPVVWFGQISASSFIPSSTTMMLSIIILIILNNLQDATRSCKLFMVIDGFRLSAASASASAPGSLLAIF